MPDKNVLAVRAAAKITSNSTGNIAPNINNSGENGIRQPPPADSNDKNPLVTIATIAAWLDVVESNDTDK